MAGDGRVDVIQAEAARGRYSISGCGKYIVREAVGPGNLECPIGDSQKPVAGGAVDSECAQTRSKGEHGGAGGALVDGDAAEASRCRQVVNTVARPGVTARARESDGNHRALAEVDRPIISQVAADGQGVCGCGHAGLEGAAEINRGVAHQCKGPSRGWIVLQDAGTVNGEIKSDCGSVDGNSCASSDHGVICGGWRVAA